MGTSVSTEWIETQKGASWQQLVEVKMKKIQGLFPQKRQKDRKVLVASSQSKQNFKKLRGVSADKIETQKGTSRQQLVEVKVLKIQGVFSQKRQKDRKVLVASSQSKQNFKKLRGVSPDKIETQNFALSSTLFKQDF